MRKILRGSICLALALLTGCYSYTSVPVATVSPGSDVRARISASEARRLAEILGRETRVLQAQLVGRENEGLLLQVRGAGSTTGTALYQRVTIRPGEIQELEIRRLDRVRTLAVAGALTAGAAIAILQFSGKSSGSRNAEGSGVDAVRIPIRSRR